MNTSEKLCHASDLDFCAWMLSAPPGSTIEYHRGNLAVDADLGLSKLADARRQELCGVRRLAFAAAAEGSVQLVQRRIGPDCFSYLAINGRRQRRIDHTLTPSAKGAAPVADQLDGTSGPGLPFPTLRS